MAVDTSEFWLTDTIAFGNRLIRLFCDNRKTSYFALLDILLPRRLDIIEYFNH